MRSRAGMERERCRPALPGIEIPGYLRSPLPGLCKEWVWESRMGRASVARDFNPGRGAALPHLKLRQHRQVVAGHAGDLQAAGVDRDEPQRPAVVDAVE